METFVNVIFSIEMQENNQLITINIYLRAYYLCTIEATRKHQLSHLLNEAFFIYLVVVIVIICISWRKSKLIKIRSFLLPYFEIAQTFFSQLYQWYLYQNIRLILLWIEKVFFYSRVKKILLKMTICDS